MSKIVSIIGCGNIGLPLAKLLLQKGYLIKGSTTREAKLKQLQQQGIQPYLINIENAESHLLSDFLQADIVVITFPPPFNKGITGKSYFEQLHIIVKHIQLAGIKKVIFVSSTDVYPQLGTWVTEQDAIIMPPRFTETPVLTLEHIFTKLSQFNTTVLRFSGLMGPDYSSGIQLARRPIKGAEDLINLVHQDDCVAIIYKIIQQDIWGEVFNVVADQHPSKQEYYNQLCDLQGFARPHYLTAQSAYRIVSNKKLKQVLEYQFLYPDPLLFLK